MLNNYVVHISCLFLAWWQQPIWWKIVSAMVCPLISRGKNRIILAMKLGLKGSLIQTSDFTDENWGTKHERDFPKVNQAATELRPEAGISCHSVTLDFSSF